MGHVGVQGKRSRRESPAKSYDAKELWRAKSYDAKKPNPPNDFFVSRFVQFSGYGV
jgi:hypothetical protein